MNDELNKAVERLENGSLFDLLRSFGKHQQLSDLRALLKAVREDSARLDWLDEMEGHANDHGRQLFTVYEIAPFTNRADKSLRAAIDTAMGITKE